MSNSEWFVTRQTIFSQTDIDNDGLLDATEARNFLLRVRELDREFYMPKTAADYSALDYSPENVEKHYFAASSLSQPFDRISFDDYKTLEKIMEAWYEAGKLEATGFINSFTGAGDSSQSFGIGQGLTQNCTTLSFDGDDRITMMTVTAGREGVTSLEIQTSKRPYKHFGVSYAYNAFSSTFWVNFIEGYDFAGLHGYVSEDGFLAGLGVVKRDSVCTQAFLTALGRYDYEWNTPRSDSFPVPSNYPAEYQQRVRLLNQRLSPSAAVAADDNSSTKQLFVSHTHEQVVETPAIIAVIAVWVIALILIVVIIVRRC